MVSWDTLYFQTKPYITNYIQLLYPAYTLVMYIYIHHVLMAYPYIIYYIYTILNSHSKNSTDVQPKKKNRRLRGTLATSSSYTA